MERLGLLVLLGKGDNIKFC